MNGENTPTTSIHKPVFIKKGKKSDGFQLEN
jgi:hypothetical protein